MDKISKKKIFFVILLVTSLLMVTNTSAISISRVNSKDINEKRFNEIYIDSELYLTSEEHLSDLEEGIINLQNQKSSEIVNEIIETIKTTGHANYEDVTNIVNQVESNEYDNIAIHFLRSISSSGPGSCFPSLWLRPNICLPSVSWKGEWKLINPAKTEIGLFNKEVYKGKQSGSAIVFSGTTSSSNDEHTYNVNGIALLTIIYYNGENENSKSFETKNLILNRIFNNMDFHLIESIINKFIYP